MTAVGTATALAELCADTIRTLLMDAVQKANSGPPATPMVLAPLAYVLFTRVMGHNPHDPQWPDRDRFVLSGHACMLLYTTLYLSRYDVSLEQDIERFRQLGSRAADTPNTGTCPGSRYHGTSGTGNLARRRDGACGADARARFSRAGHDVIDHRRNQATPGSGRP